MKHSFTLENDLAMIIDLLSEMVENENLSQKQMEQIMEKIFSRISDEKTHDNPSETVVNNIMSYSHALDVVKTENDQTFNMIIN